MEMSAAAVKRTTSVLLLAFFVARINDVDGQTTTQVTTACVQWTSYVDQNSLNGVSYPQYTTLTDCQAFCASFSACLALDFDQSTTPCWIHVNPNDLGVDNTFNVGGVTQFVVNRSCSASPNCYQWTSYVNQNSLFATNFEQFVNLADCLAFCLSYPQCVAVDYENNSSSPCWVHTNIADLTTNTYSLVGRTQYILNRGCSSNGCVQWLAFDRQNSISATNYPQLRTLSDCLAFCGSNPQCVAVDFDNSGAPCWVHTNGNDLTPANTYGVPTSTQYIGNRTCETLSCAQWTLFQNQKSVRGIQYAQYTTVADCLQFCVVTAQCIGIDFGSNCWIHVDQNDFSNTNLLTIVGWSQYILSRACTPTTTGCVQWSSFTPQNSLNGILFAKYKTLTDCLAFCAATPWCVAVDYDSSSTPCYVHFSAADLAPDNTYNLPGITQYIISRSCNFGTVSWTANPARSSLNGVNFPQYKTLAACQAACLSTVYCVAIDYDSTTNPCWLHLSAGDLSASNTYVISGVTQYIANRTFPFTTTTVTTRSTTTTTTTPTTSVTSLTSTTTPVVTSSTSPSTVPTSSTSLSTTTTTMTTTTTTYNPCLWTTYINTNVPGGTTSRFIDLASCQAACIQNSNCIGVDIDSNPGSSNVCWLTIIPQASGTLSYYPNTVHYALTRRSGCLYAGVSLTTITPNTVTSSIGYFLRKMLSVNSDGAIPLGVMNETACVMACLAQYPSCLAADYRLADSVCYSHTSISNRKWNSCCRRYELTGSGSSTACTDTLAAFTRLIVTSTVGTAGTTPVASQTAASCQAQCLSNSGCTGLMWISNVAVVPSGLQQCTLYTQLINGTTTTTDTSFTTYIRQSCIPNIPLPTPGPPVLGGR